MNLYHTESILIQVWLTFWMRVAGCGNARGAGAIDPVLGAHVGGVALAQVNLRGVAVHYMVVSLSPARACPSQLRHGSCFARFFTPKKPSLRHSSDHLHIHSAVAMKPSVFQTFRTIGLYIEYPL